MSQKFMFLHAATIAGVAGQAAPVHLPVIEVPVIGNMPPLERKIGDEFAMCTHTVKLSTLAFVGTIDEYKEYIMQQIDRAYELATQDGRTERAHDSWPSGIVTACDAMTRALKGR